MGEDLISRQAAIDALGERPIAWDEWTDEYELGQRKQWDSDKLAIETVPSAQKTGKWLRERLASTTGGTYTIVRCSACMGDMPFEWPAKYCPHCGARMESD